MGVLIKKNPKTTIEKLQSKIDKKVRGLRFVKLHRLIAFRGFITSRHYITFDQLIIFGQFITLIEFTFGRVAVRDIAVVVELSAVENAEEGKNLLWLRSPEQRSNARYDRSNRSFIQDVRTV